MFIKTVKRGISKKTEKSVKIFTLKKGEKEYDKGTIRYVVGKAEVDIISTNASYGCIPIKGKKNLQLLRDAMIEICRIEGIE